MLYSYHPSWKGSFWPLFFKCWHNFLQFLEKIKMWITRQIEGSQKDCVHIQAAKQETLAKPPLPPPPPKKKKVGEGEGERPTTHFHAEDNYYKHSIAIG